MGQQPRDPRNAPPIHLTLLHPRPLPHHRHPHNQIPPHPLGRLRLGRRQIRRRTPTLLAAILDIRQHRRFESPHHPIRNISRLPAFRNGLPRLQSPQRTHWKKHFHRISLPCRSHVWFFRFRTQPFRTLSGRNLFHPRYNGPRSSHQPHRHRRRLLPFTNSFSLILLFLLLLLIIIRQLARGPIPLGQQNQRDCVRVSAIRHD